MKRLAWVLGAVVLVTSAGCGPQTPAKSQEKALREQKAQLRQEQIARLHRKAATVRTRLVTAELARRGPADHSAQRLLALIGMLRDKDPEVQRWAVVALGNLGAQAKPAVPILTDLLEDRRLRNAAAEALRKIGASA